MDADEIRRELEAARADARRLAVEQQAWRSRVSGVFERGHAAGLTVNEMVEALGLSGKWTEYQRQRVLRQMTRVSALPSFFGFGPPPL